MATSEEQHVLTPFFNEFGPSGFLPYVLDLDALGLGEGPIRQTLAFAVLIRQGGVLLALPDGALPRGVLFTGNVVGSQETFEGGSQLFISRRGQPAAIPWQGAEVPELVLEEAAQQGLQQRRDLYTVSQLLQHISQALPGITTKLQELTERTAAIEAMGGGPAERASALRRPLGASTMDGLPPSSTPAQLLKEMPPPSKSTLTSQAFAARKSRSSLHSCPRTRMCWHWQ